MCDKYNGWKNKPTWLVAVWGWFDDPEIYESLIERAVDRQMKWESDNPQFGHKNRLNIIYFQLGELIEEYITDYLESNHDGETRNNFEQDLLNWSLAIVDWQRLAELLEERVKEYIAEVENNNVAV